MVSFIRLHSEIMSFNLFYDDGIKINLGFRSQIRHNSLLILFAKISTNTNMISLIRSLKEEELEWKFNTFPSKLNDAFNKSQY